MTLSTNPRTFPSDPSLPLPSKADKNISFVLLSYTRIHFPKSESLLLVDERHTDLVLDECVVFPKPGLILPLKGTKRVLNGKSPIWTGINL